MPTSDFLWYASGSGATVRDQTDWAAAPTTLNGAGSGTLLSPDYDKLGRQATAGSAAIGAFIAAQGFNAHDDGVLSNLVTAFESALSAFTQANATPAGRVSFVDSPIPDAGNLGYDGSSLSRTTYANLMAATTGALVGSTTNGNSNLTYSACTYKGQSVTPQVGWYVSGPSIALGTVYIQAISGSTLTLYNTATGAAYNATASEAAGTAFVISQHPLGDGVNTFNIGDGRGEFFRGWDNGRGIDAGRTLGSTQGGMIESHSHSAPDSGHTHLIGQTISITPSGSTPVIAQVGSSAYTIVSYANISISATGGNETRPTNVALLAQIKY